MEKKNLKVVVYLLTGMIGFGLGLIAVSLFMSFMDLNVNSGFAGFGTSGSLELFDADWDMLDVSPAFVIISYLVLIAGLVVMAIDASVKQKMKKKIKGLNFVGLALTVVGFALLIVSIFITKGKVEDAMDNLMIAALKMSGEVSGMSDQQILTMLRMVMSYELGIGSIMAIIGGIIAIIGSVMIVIPAFDPMKLAAEQAAPAATPAAEQPAQNTEANDNNNDTIA